MTGPPPQCASRGVAGTALAIALALGATACTGGSEPAAAPASDRPSSPSGGASAVAGPPSVPMRTQVTHVAGRLPAKERRGLAARVGRTISAYVDAAFLDGEYPRSRFGASFAAFTPAAARQARGDQPLLTNQPWGPTTRAVRATRRTAYLSVLAPDGRVSGATAAVDLVFRVDRGGRPARKVRLKGRLLLTHDGKGRWAIFGYDLARSGSRVGGAS